MERPKACVVVNELAIAWQEGKKLDGLLEMMEGIGFEWGLRFALNYPEYAVALRNALNSLGDKEGTTQRFLANAALIIEKNPIEEGN